ncbi:MAG: alpha/beta hydrolase [Actinomycetes bacterium]
MTATESENPTARNERGAADKNAGGGVGSAARWPGEFVQLGSARLFVRHAEPIGSTTEPAVFVHGLGGSATNWTDLMGGLRDVLDGYAVDLPGFGRSPVSDAGSEDYTPAGHAAVVAEYIRHSFGGRPVHVFGNSLGGAVAVQLGARHPELVRTMTLVSPALPDRMPMLSNISMPVVAIPRLGEWMNRRMAGRPAVDRAVAMVDMCWAEPSRVSPARRADLITDIEERDQLDHAQPVMLASLRGLVATFFDESDDKPWSLAGRIDVPVIAVYGRDDKLVNPRAAFRASKAFPNARVVVIPDSGHVSQMEHPDLIADLWRELAR